MHWARSALVEIEFLVADGVAFSLTQFITALADAERTAFAGRAGAGITDIVMCALGYTWRDNASSVLSPTISHADFIYGGGAVAAHGVVLAEAHGSFAQSVNGTRMSGEARHKYVRQVKPHIATTCEHGDVIHGYSVAFGSNPSSLDTYLHVAETRISKDKGKPNPLAPQAEPRGAGAVPTSLALAAHRSNFLLMGATQVVAWIDWLRGTGDQPAEDYVTTFFTIEVSGRRFLAAAEHFFPYARSRFLFEELEFPRVPWPWEEFERWRHRLRGGLANVFAMDEWAAKSFLLALSAMIRGGRDQVPLALDLPDIEPFGFSPDLDRGYRDEDARYPVAQFRDGLALLSRLPRSPAPDARHWSPQRGFI
ncbi:hypothetical protein HNR60_003286 [Rhodopseudomonas rhenobacensis]|uniref:Uncharacterized protein n=1 Tax=Rhodopseudomonas rhenobacensis TaxID=87461 RepID=A0A7W7Z5Q7_9BRAD|nr:hypothetical protein [Rhodopseudomonas rhenobacensis]MBB5048519.1 hypothetical protein [Rhodopseudomonas rhenobacensis]